MAYRCRWKENATISVVGKIMAEASAAASQIAGGERRAVSAAHVTPQRLRNIYVHSGASLRPSTHYRRRDGLFGGWGDASGGRRRSGDGCAGSGALTRWKMAKKAIRGANQLEKKKRWIDGNVFVIKFVFRYTCLILQSLQSLPGFAVQYSFCGIT